MTSIGIDLGTTYSCVAAVKNGRVEVIANAHGKRITPSCVAFTEKEWLIGDFAKVEKIFHPENTVFDMNRMIGREFKDENLAKDMLRWPFKVVRSGNKPKVEVEYKEQIAEFFPEELSAMVLSRLKEMASAYLGKEVKSAVITVPAYFNLAQRRATKDAAEIAGLHVLSMINEPTAAALAYGLQEKSAEKRHVVVFDCGRRSLNVTVLTVEDNVYDVAATGEASHIGGEYFKDRLFEYLLRDFTTNNEVDSTDMSEKAKSRLTEECKRVKIDLEISFRASIHVYSFMHGIDFAASITRTTFVFLCEDLFQDALDMTKKILTEAEITKDEVDEVLLVGGSSRIPYITKMLEEHFGENKIRNTINPDEAVACGAAVYAANSSKESIREKFPSTAQERYAQWIESSSVQPHTSVKRDRDTPIKNQRSVIIVNKDDYGSLMESFVPDDNDWIDFGKKYLVVDERNLNRAKRQYRGEQLKTEILKMWIKKYGSRATVSRAYDLGLKFRSDKLEEMFRFLVKLIPDANEWKNFATYGLKLTERTYGDKISDEQKLGMLRQWLQREDHNNAVDKLCVVVRTHFKGKPTMSNAICDTIFGWMPGLCEATKKISFNVHVQNYGTWNCRDAFIGCQGTNIDY